MTIDKQKRRWLSLGGIALGACCLPQSVMAMVSTPKPRLLSFYNVNTREKLTAQFSITQGFSSNVSRQMDHFMRDKRNNLEHKMDVKLFHKFYQLQDQLGVRNATIQIICGYRSPATNAMRHRQSRGVAANSYHMKGQAIDFRIDGVPLAKVKQAAMNLRSGGVGFYPRSNFIHVDTGPVRSWQGV